MDIKNLKEMVSLVASGVKVGMRIAEDKKVDLVADMPLVFVCLQKLPAAIEGADLIPSELADMDAAEAADLVAFIMSELALEQEHATKVIEASLKTLVSIYGLVVAIKA